MRDQKVPLNELLGSKKLHGRYKVSFILNVDENDDISISDINQALAEGFSEPSILNKMSDVELEKVNKQGNLLSPTLKVGDIVRLTEDILITANVSYDASYYTMGSEHTEAEQIGEVTTKIEEGLRATVNSIDGDNIELIDFDSVVTVDLEDRDTLEIVPTPVNIDIVTVSKSSLEKVDE